MLREHIIETALDLFARYGIKKVSMNDIARTAGVSKRTLYEFFSDKETLLKQVTGATYLRMSASFGKVAEDTHTALEALLLFNEQMMDKPTWYCTAFYTDIKRYPGVWEQITAYKQTFLDTVTLLMKRGIREGVFDPGINFDIVRLLMRSHMSMSPPAELFGVFPPADVYNAVFLIFVRGICTENGRKILERYETRKQSRILVQ
ncbi:MAG: TetR/AcrR family transcriptional regulator [Tannerella sp.]|jgi:AcrR family transcriptional regulator|nr:TetR/AcrR family transcriptional regulator [Tannerella sp.]